MGHPESGSADESVSGGGDVDGLYRQRVDMSRVSFLPQDGARRAKGDGDRWCPPSELLSRRRGRLDAWDGTPVRSAASVSLTTSRSTSGRECVAR